LLRSVCARACSPKMMEEERINRAAAADVPFEPMEQKHGVSVTMSKRWKYVFADISKGVTGEVLCPICPMCYSLLHVL